MRILTTHKSKGLEFEKVVVLGVEHEFSWGRPPRSHSEFFVAISRAKNHVVLTHATIRPRPSQHSGRWDERRTCHSEFLAYAEDD
ncbi:ATP-binding domain-containing protein [Nocardioides sp. TF02-7]|nr:ATP-binding domain-containing protein [Nocardioides sp. TF02-7]